MGGADRGLRKKIRLLNKRSGLFVSRCAARVSRLAMRGPFSA